MNDLPAPNEWEQLTFKMGELTIAAGCLEMAIIAMVCRILNRTEEDLNIRSNWRWCKKFLESAPTTWSDAERTDLAIKIEKVRELYTKRNKLIHTALGTVSDDSIPGVLPGSIVDLRTYGLGVTERTANSAIVGVVGRRVSLKDVAELTQAMHDARIDLVPQMELVDKIKHQGNLDDLAQRLAQLEIGRPIG